MTTRSFDSVLYPPRRGRNPVHWPGIPPPRPRIACSLKTTEDRQSLHCGEAHDFTYVQKHLKHEEVA
jgi:hypothetical protein